MPLSISTNIPATFSIIPILIERKKLCDLRVAAHAEMLLQHCAVCTQAPGAGSVRLALKPRRNNSSIPGLCVYYCYAIDNVCYIAYCRGGFKLFFINCFSTKMYLWQLSNTYAYVLLSSSK